MPSAPSKRHRYMVVAFWGTETTVEFFATNTKAVTHARHCVDQGADVALSKVLGIHLNDQSPWSK